MRIRKPTLIELHQWLSKPLLELVNDLDLTSWWAYTLEYGIFHALSVPEKELAYRTIEGWVHNVNPTMKRKALRGILLLLQYSATLDEGMSILSRTDQEIRSFLSSVVPEPIIRSAEKCATIGQKDLTNIGQADLMQLIFLFADFDNLITYLLVIQCADILYKGHTLQNIDSMFTRATLGSKVRSIIQVRQIEYEATMPTLQKLPKQIFHDLQRSAEQMVSLRNHFMHGAIDSQDPDVYRQIYNMAWDFKLLFFCLCECQTEYDVHHDVQLHNTTYKVCTPKLKYKGQSISLWPFYLILRSEVDTHWFIHNMAKSGQSKYLEVHTNEETRPIRGNVQLEHPSIDGLLSLRAVPMKEISFVV